MDEKRTSHCPNCQHVRNRIAYNLCAGWVDTFEAQSGTSLAYTLGKIYSLYITEQLTQNEYEELTFRAYNRFTGEVSECVE